MHADDKFGANFRRFIYESEDVYETEAGRALHFARYATRDIDN